MRPPCGPPRRPTGIRRKRAVARCEQPRRRAAGSDVATWAAPAAPGRLDQPRNWRSAPAICAITTTGGSCCTSGVNRPRLSSSSGIRPRRANRMWKKTRRLTPTPPSASSSSPADRDRGTRRPPAGRTRWRRWVPTQSQAGIDEPVGFAPGPEDEAARSPSSGAQRTGRRWPRTRCRSGYARVKSKVECLGEYMGASPTPRRRRFTRSPPAGTFANGRFRPCVRRL